MRPRPSLRLSAARKRQQARARHLRRVGALVVVAAILLVVLVLTAFGSSPAAVRTALPAPAKRLLPAGPPRPQVIATVGGIRLQLPIPQERVSSVGYHRARAGELALSPVGSRGNRGLLSRAFHRVFGGGGTHGMRWYQLSGGGQGPPTSTLDVGAPAGTDVYSPVDGTIVGLTKYILDGRRYGVRLDIQPADAPSILVSLTRLRLDPALSVGSSLQAGTSKLGTVLDLSTVERQELARYTQDAGNHVSLDARSAANLALP